MIKRISITVFTLFVLFKELYCQQENRIVLDTSPQVIQTSDWPVFKTYPAYSTDSLQYCKYLQNSDVYYFQNGGIEYLALSLRTCGFNLFSIQDPSNPQLQVNFPIQTGRINKFSYDVLRNILWIAHSEGKIYYIDIESKPFKVEFGFQTNKSIKSIFINYIPKVNNAILVICLNEIQIFSSQSSNLKDISSLKYYKSITLENANDIMKIIFKNNLLLVGTALQGVQYYQVSQGQSIDFSLKYLNNTLPVNVVMFDFVITSKNIIYLQMAGTYSFNANDCITKGDINSCSNITPVQTRTSPQKTGNMYLTRDENYLFTHYSNYGIQIFDISQIKMKNFQIIDTVEEALTITLNYNESLIFQTGSSKLQIFQRNHVNIQLDKPNILLQIIQFTDQTFYRNTSVLLPDPHCYLDNQRNLLYISRFQFGITILKKNPQSILKTIVKFEENVKGQSYGFFKFFQNSTIAYVTKSIQGLAIINFTIPENPVYIQQQIKFGVSPLFYFFECSENFQICGICSQQTGVLFINITNITDPQLIKIFPVKNNSFLNYFYVCFMRYQKVAFLAGDQFGVYAVDLNDQNFGNMISSLYLNDGIFLATTQDDKYLLATSAIRGLVIIDITNLKELKIVSTVKLFGKPTRFNFMSDQKYIVVIIQEKSGLILIDIQNKQNPVILQTLKRKTPENLQAICFDSDESEGFISTGRPLIQTNFKNQVIFHKIVYQLQSIPDSDEKKYIDIDTSSPLYVGQVYYIRVLPLKIDNAVSIKKVMVYENYVLQPLKSWMTFKSESNVLYLNILKEALSQDQKGNFINTSLQIIFQSHIALDSSSFVNSNLEINLDLSTKILAECQKQGYLDEIFMVSENFNNQSQVSINFEKIVSADFFAKLTDEKKDERKDDMIKAIKYVFKQSISYYPIEFIASPSLQFDQKNSEKQFISSLINQVSIYIRVSKGQGKFVDKIYPGVLSIISSQQDEIKIEGEIKKVNEILSQNIKFSSIISSADITFFIQIQDGINYDIYQQFKYSDSLFISEQTKVQLKSEKSIKNDFSSKIESSAIYINERFSYQIPTEIFDCEENQQLYFSAKIQNSEGQYIEIPLNHWIQFSSVDRIFSGQPSQKEFKDILKFKINISDKYSFVEQELTIYVSKVPVLYILAILAQVIGPLLGIIGFWKYRYMIINVVQKKNYTYSKEIIQAGKIYQKQILLNNWNIEVAQNILEQFKKIVTPKEIAQQIYFYQSLNLKIQGNSSSPLIQKLNLENFALCKQDEIQISLNQQTYIGTELKDEVISPIQKDTYDFQKVNPFSDEQIFQKPILINRTDSQGIEIKENSVQLNSEQQHKLDQSIVQGQFQNLNNQQKRLSQYGKRSFTFENSTDQKTNQRIKKFSKQLKQQFEKLNKSKLDQSQIEKQNSKIENILKKSTYVESELWLFNHSGNINYCSTFNLLIQNNGKSKNQNKTMTEEVIQHLRNQNSLLRQTFECFLAEFILQKDSFSYNIFKELYNKTQHPLPNPEWYKLYCNIMPNFSGIHKNPVPIITFNDSSLEFEIKSLIFGQNKNEIETDMLEKIPLSLSLLKQVIKGYALGFVSDSAQLKPISRGESLHIENYNIKQIISFSQRIDNQLQTTRNKLKYNCQKKQKIEFIEKPLVDNYKLPPWIKSVEIINNNLLIVGYPENKDIGRDYFFIYSKLNYIIRAFEIEVVESEKTGQQNQENSGDENSPLIQNTFQSNIQKKLVKRKILLSQDQTPLQDKKSNYDFYQDHQNSIFEDDIQKERQPHKNQFTN